MKKLAKALQIFLKYEESNNDMFMGTGTIAVALKLLNRNFIGFELNENYYKDSLNKLEL